MKVNILKKYVSVFELFTRNTIYKIAMLLTAMGTVQILLFRRVMEAYIPMAAYDFVVMEYYSLEYMIDESHSAVFLAIAFVLLTAVLCRNGCNIGSKSSYTMQRLQVTEKKVFLMQCIYNSLCYGLLLGVQVAVFLIQGSMYTAYSEHVTNQTVFLAFYRNDFMHSVLPLDGGMRWVTNFIFVVGCGVSAAVFTYLQRRGKTAWSLFIVIACILVGFIRELKYQYLGLGFAIVIGIIAGFTVYWHVLCRKGDSCEK